METEYNWKAVLTGALPVSAIIIFIFYSNISKNLKWLFLIVGITISFGVTYYIDRKKHNVFTSPLIVIAAALLVNALKNLGII
ncbi:hypothetical protein HYX01_02500 [Candidatus Woesearchaeota archaeon]|nr:hypothetical protein [Candidatus Woesearchaeota archaeon]